VVSLCTRASRPATSHLPHMRRLDFPAWWVRARFEPLPISGGAGSLVGGGGVPSGGPPVAVAAPWRRLARGSTGAAFALWGPA
jgi:hypothetical protein